MKSFMFSILAYNGVCFGLIFPIPQLIKEKCLNQDDPAFRQKFERFEKESRLCEGHIFHEHENYRAGLEHRRRNGTLTELFHNYYGVVNDILKCMKPISDLGMECLPLEDKIYINKTEKVSQRLLEYVFGDDAQRSVDFVEGGGFACLDKEITDNKKCQIDYNEPDVKAGSCKIYSKTKTCVMDIIQEKCQNATSYYLDIIDMIQSAVCTSENADYEEEDNRKKTDIQYQDILDSTRHAILSLIPRRSRMTFKNIYEKNKTELDNAINDMKICLEEKPLFETPKEEYLEHIGNCSNTIKELLNKCLPEKFLYLSKFVFKVVESLVMLLYNDFSEIERESSTCFPRLKLKKSEAEYLKCVGTVADTYDHRIPQSKEQFCDAFVPASECYVKQINDTCTFNENIEKLTNDYLKAMKDSC